MISTEIDALTRPGSVSGLGERSIDWIDITSETAATMNELDYYWKLVKMRSVCEQLNLALKPFYYMKGELEFTDNQNSKINKVGEIMAGNIYL